MPKLIILFSKGDEFSKKKIVKFPFYRTVTNLNNLIFNVGLVIYTGTGEAPYFMDSGELPVIFATEDTGIMPASNY